eukprot:TRINITY_DN1089_c0_g1_i1.p1 TRINITY_DN1089_c0_g1~~TRINITY_DN1089_c0_g1_i1.p1  ORF type:complete len:741 (+),score=154.81 TRINITY_DN1089_c0_g1_i1:199-2421(+)
MNFPVPWRCLLPSEAVDYVVYDSNAVLRELSDRSGALIDVSGEHDTPKRLSDRILTISGLAEQKELACRGIVERLRKLQDLHFDDNIGFFVVIVPAAAVPVVVGQKGATIREIMGDSGVELSIGKENVMGMPDTPIGLEGTCDQVVSACASLHRVIQEMADRGRLLPADFKYRPDRAAAALASGAGQGIPEVNLPRSGADTLQGLDPTQNYRTKAKLVVDTQTAGWLIGKGGRTIREMQGNSGAFLHVLREEECLPADLNPGDRVVEVCGRYERKLEGIQVVLRTADNMPGGQAPRETRILVPAQLVVAEVMADVVSSTGAEAVQPLHESAGRDEVMLLLTGSISSRIQAAQAFLTLTDKAHADGTIVALSIDGEVIGKDGRMRKEIREDPAAKAAALRAAAPPPNDRAAPSENAAAGAVLTAQELQPRRPLQPRSDFTTARSESRFTREAPQDWALAPAAVEEFQPYPQRREAQLDRPSEDAKVAPAAAPIAQQQQLQQHQQQQQQQQLPRHEPHSSHGDTVRSSRQDEVFEERLSSAPSHQRPFERASNSDPTMQQDRPKQHVLEASPLEQQANGFLESRPQTVQSQPQLEPQLEQRNGLHVGFEASAVPPPCPEPPAEEAPEPRPPLSHEQEGDSMADVGVAWWPLPSHVHQLLANSTMCGGALSRLMLLLPRRLTRQHLIPRGRLQEVAQRCGVRIDLHSEVEPDGIEVSITGTVLANTVAAYGLQACCLPGGGKR